MCSSRSQPSIDEVIKRVTIKIDETGKKKVRKRDDAISECVPERLDKDEG
jgi:hypothetical protein